MKKSPVYCIVLTAMMSALAAVLLVFEFPIFPATPWLQLNISDMPALLTAFLLNPWLGVVVELVRILLFLAVLGTSSAFVGELSNLMIPIAFVLPAGYLFRIRKNLTSALIGLIVGSVCMVIAATLTNVYILLPLYDDIVPPESIPALIPPTILFNVIKAVATSAVTMALCAVLKRTLPGIWPAEKKPAEKAEKKEETAGPSVQHDPTR